MSDEETLRTVQLVEGGHLLYADEDDPGRVDNWRVGEGYHNGPACAACHEAWCKHCHPEKMREQCWALNDEDTLDGVPIDGLLSATEQRWRDELVELRAVENGTIVPRADDERA